MRTNRIGIVLLGAFVAGCSGAGEPEAQDDVGVVRIALTGTPADVACIGITVVGGSRIVSRRFDAVPGTSQTFMLNTLPLGSDVFTGQAYSAACSGVSDATSPDWLSDAVTAALAKGVVPDVALLLKRNGRANVSVGFDDGGPVCGDGVIQSGEQCDGSNLGGSSCTALGFVGGSLSCDPTCHFNVTACSAALCGNGVIEGGEECDGANLNGETCVDFGFTSGILRCTNCAFDFGGCRITGPLP